MSKYRLAREWYFKAMFCQSKLVSLASWYRGLLKTGFEWTYATSWGSTARSSSTSTYLVERNNPEIKVQEATCQQDVSCEAL